ncbi:hypothetical protein [Rufibacter latericius]|uniref:Uncharacterized protein n=1 Tax=Rufibacter latericius TaxID=2487040 RepID=A0A3M9MCZ3_9BACT|nr:hypothetical protein [Rufibacter latericius]RNI23384.1 hypothetical protein EFB08_17705 [Rufibacter latericius]
MTSYAEIEFNYPQNNGVVKRSSSLILTVEGDINIKADNIFNNLTNLGDRVKAAELDRLEQNGEIVIIDKSTDRVKYKIL